MDYYYAYKRKTAQLQFLAAEKIMEAIQSNVACQYFGGIVGLAFGTTLNITTYLILWRSVSWYEFACTLPFMMIWILFMSSMMSMILILTATMTYGERRNFIDKMKKSVDEFLSEIPEPFVSKKEELKNIGKDSDNESESDEEDEEKVEELEKLIKNIKEDVVCKPKSEKVKKDTVDYCGEPFPKNESSDSEDL